MAIKDIKETKLLGGCGYWHLCEHLFNVWDRGDGYAEITTKIPKNMMNDDFDDTIHQHLLNNRDIIACTVHGHMSYEYGGVHSHNINQFHESGATSLSAFPGTFRDKNNILIDVDSIEDLEIALYKQFN